MIQAQEMIGGFCTSRGGCLKTILWPLAPGLPVTSLPPEKFDATVNQDGSNEPCIPLLCAEACNLLVARAREVVKQSAGRRTMTILRARTVLPLCRPPIDNGAVAIEGGRIVAVGPLAEVTARCAGAVLDLGEQVLLPGLINAHCHLDYTMLRRSIQAPAQLHPVGAAHQRPQALAGRRRLPRGHPQGLRGAAQMGHRPPC